MRPTLELEQAAWDCGQQIVAGVDEAGRGPLAGPVVAAAVVLDPHSIPDGITDSKKLTAQMRERLFEAILESADVGIALSDPEQIDRDNILAATLDAMRRAVGELTAAPALVLVDGNRAPRALLRMPDRGQRRSQVALGGSGLYRGQSLARPHDDTS